jgi:formamidopyrimidine-DNA glycosylase
VPELPEVETTRRGLLEAMTGRRLVAVRIHDRRLRWPIEEGLEAAVAGAHVIRLERRAKYLLIVTDRGTLIVHLGMSGSLRVVTGDWPLRPHDHVELALDHGPSVRFNDPRRFGSLHWVTGDPMAHPLLAGLGPEPLSEAFSGEQLYRVSRGRKVAVKILILNAAHVVGVGNIYASESLFHAGIRPTKAAGKLTRAEAQRLAAEIKRVLGDAIEVGGTTLRDYVDPEGNPGYFRQRLYVYERDGKACRRCQTPISHRVIGQRSTYWCPTCQR